MLGVVKTHAGLCSTCARHVGARFHEILVRVQVRLNLGMSESRQVSVAPGWVVVFFVTFCDWLLSSASGTTSTV